MATGEQDTTPVRKRDSVATRQALLDAARELFGTHGFEQTTLRDIGERAGVDASLIARYFGNKVALYHAAVASDAPPPFDPAGPLTVEGLVSGAIARADLVGLSPLTRAFLQPEVDDDVRAASAEYLQRRVLRPLTSRLAETGIDQPALRAELLLAAFFGIIAVRAGASLPVLGSAPADELTHEVTALLDRFLSDEFPGLKPQATPE